MTDGEKWVNFVHAIKLIGMLQGLNSTIHVSTLMEMIEAVEKGEGKGEV